jgi:FkbM family methyltransferase
MKTVKGWCLPDADSYFGPLLEASEEEGFQTDRLREVLEFVAGPRRTALDIGAHVGMWSVPLARTFEQVYSFEPAQDTFDCLHVNTSKNKNIQVIPCALGDKESFAQMRDGKDPGNTGSRYFVYTGEASETSVEVVTLDSLGLTNVDFIKMDVEGAELEVIQGGRETLRRNKPVICVEIKKAFFGRFSAGPGAVYSALSALGATCVARFRADHVFAWR